MIINNTGGTKIAEYHRTIDMLENMFDEYKTKKDIKKMADMIKLELKKKE